MLKSSEYATGIQTDFFDLMDKRYVLNIEEYFSNMFSLKQIERLYSGLFY